MIASSASAHTADNTTVETPTAYNPNCCQAFSNSNAGNHSHSFGRGQWGLCGEHSCPVSKPCCRRNPLASRTAEEYECGAGPEFCCSEESACRSPEHVPEWTDPPTTRTCASRHGNTVVTYDGTDQHCVPLFCPMETNSAMALKRCLNCRGKDVLLPFPTTQLGSVVTIDCPSETHQGQIRRKCTKAGWDTIAGACERRSCPKHTVKLSLGEDDRSTSLEAVIVPTIEFPMSPEGTNVTLSCDVRSGFEGSLSRQCLTNGGVAKWGELQGNCIPAPPFVDGSFDNAN